jgi:hypothetical protein
VVIPKPIETLEDAAGLDDPPEPSQDLLDFTPDPSVPRNVLPGSVNPSTDPLRSSRRPTRERTLSAIRRYIRT